MRLSLGAKFILTVLVILAGTMAVNATFVLRTSARFHEDQLLERGRALGHVISLVSPEAIVGYDFLLLNEYAREVSSLPDVVYGVIVSPEGAPMTSYVNRSDPLIAKHLTPNELGGPMAPEALTELLRRLDSPEELIKLEFPIAHNGRLLGRFLVGISRESLHQEFREQLVAQLLIFAAVVLFLIGAIYAVFRLNVLHPIRRLIAASQAVGRGEYTLVDASSGDELGVLAGAFNAMTREVKAEQAKLHRQANFDVLTGLPNRLMAYDRITLEIHRARRSGQRFAVLFIDLDDFKNINDSLGHAVGDQLLVVIGSRLQASVRDTDTVARLGGDEFLVLLPDVANEIAVESVTDRLLQAVAEPHSLGGRKVAIKCSIGIALYPENGATLEALMANADNAMYQAKATDHGSASFFTQEMNVRLYERMQLEQDLNTAIELGQLKLHFQPILDSTGQRHAGAEVLLRWHAGRGPISPAVFIPLAESTGQIVAIGNWVLEQSCRCWSQWARQGIHPGFLAINISRVQFRKRFSQKLSELMMIHGIPAHALELEITESVLLDDHKQVAEELQTLRAMGLRLSLDDFGTGYSSLSYLKRFRFDVLKIDRSFVAGLPENPDDVSLVKAILAMAHGLDLRVVAEGVESRAQLQFLAAHGCDFAQGYFFARPMNEEAYQRYLTERQAGDETTEATTHNQRIG
jgi:diguanylate cyclase (GGDEF)-like protein